MLYFFRKLIMINLCFYVRSIDGDDEDFIFYHCDCFRPSGHMLVLRVMHV